MKQCLHLYCNFDLFIIKSNELKGNYLLLKHKASVVLRHKTQPVNIQSLERRFKAWWDALRNLPLHFFFAAKRFGADTFTFPGMFLDRSVSCKTAASHDWSRPIIRGTNVSCKYLDAPEQVLLSSAGIFPSHEAQHGRTGSCAHTHTRYVTFTHT